MFFEENRERLEAFAKMSQEAGARADYVQGGGGNTSVKFPDGKMAIKASGFCLKDIRPDRAYAVLNGKAIRDFYYGHETADLADVEKEGAAATKANTLSVEGLDPLRPSVEAGFHSILKTYVLHTHSVYANLAACSTECVAIAEKAFEGADYTFGWVPYTDPGANLTFAIRDELARVEKETGKCPAVILMQNHGIIAHADDAEEALRIHADANERIAAQFGITGDAFPAIVLREEDGILKADVPYLSEILSSGRYSYEQLMNEPLYPDQMVFLRDTFFMDVDEIADGTCAADSKTGSLLLKMDEKKAMTMTETLTAVLFIMEKIREAGKELSTMGAAAQDFIANWESEKYRKSLTSK